MFALLYQYRYENVCENKQAASAVYRLFLALVKGLSPLSLTGAITTLVHWLDKRTHLCLDSLP